jgi:deazaflavin-dependent oxidoreductase (nitroreductase family)
MTADINDWNDRIIAEFRENAGHVAWSTDAELAAGRPVPPPLPAYGDRPMPVLLLHHVGARTGRARINPLLYLSVDDAYAVFAAYGGSRTDPAWYRNLMARPRTVVELGTDTIPVRARRIDGAERHRVWTIQAALTPKFTEFAAAAGREIPVVLLVPEVSR